MRTVPFKPEHLDHMDVDDAAMAAFRKIAGSLPGPAKTLMDGETPVGAFGIVVTGDTGWSWAVFSEALRRHPVALHRTALKELEAVTGLRAVHGTVKYGWDEGARWLRRLGYVRSGTIRTEEGLLERYTRWASNPQ